MSQYIYSIFGESITGTYKGNFHAKKVPCPVCEYSAEAVIDVYSPKKTGVLACSRCNLYVSTSSGVIRTEHYHLRLNIYTINGRPSSYSVKRLDALLPLIIAWEKDRRQERFAEDYKGFDHLFETRE